MGFFKKYRIVKLVDIESAAKMAQLDEKHLLNFNVYEIQKRTGLFKWERVRLKAGYYTTLDEAIAGVEFMKHQDETKKLIERISRSQQVVKKF